MVERGVFGGAYFRPINSKVTDRLEQNAHYEFPRLFNNLPENWLANPQFDKNINYYNVLAGQDLDEWESKNWIVAQDPYGWFQWYCRFFEGRRSPDDARQIDRWQKYAGPKQGRWRTNLINKINKEGKQWNDFTVSPVIRQGLLQWGYELTLDDFLAK